MNDLNQEALELIRKALTDYGTELIKNLKVALANHKASGALEKSLAFEVTVKENTIVLQVTALEYLEWLDQGRKPGKMPPIEPILKWIQRKGIKPRSLGLNKSKRSLYDRQMGLAFAIAEKVKKKGEKPLHIIDPAIEKTDSEAWDALETAIGRALEFGIKTMIESTPTPKGVKVSVSDH